MSQSHEGLLPLNSPSAGVPSPGAQGRSRAARDQQHCRRAGSAAGLARTAPPRRYGVRVAYDRREADVPGFTYFVRAVHPVAGSTPRSDHGSGNVA
jgi:hypothetical protein